MCTENSQNTVKTTTTTTENIVIFNFLLGHYPLILQTFPLTLKHKIELQNKTRVKKINMENSFTVNWQDLHAFYFLNKREFLILLLGWSQAWKQLAISAPSEET